MIGLSERCNNDWNRQFRNNTGQSIISGLLHGGNKSRRGNRGGTGAQSNQSDCCQKQLGRSRHGSGQCQYSVCCGNGKKGQCCQCIAGWLKRSRQGQCCQKCTAGVKPQPFGGGGWIIGLNVNVGRENDVGDHSCGFECDAKTDGKQGCGHCWFTMVSQRRWLVGWHRNVVDTVIDHISIDHLRKCTKILRP